MKPDRSFDLGTHAVHLRWREEEAPVRDPSLGLSFLLKQKGETRPIVEGDAVIDLRSVDAIEEPAGFRPVFEGTFDTGTTIRLASDEDGWTLLTAQSRLATTDRPTHLVMDVLSTAGQAAADAMVMALEHAHALARRVLIHAACIESASGTVLLHAPSGAGKTTTALALAIAGLPLQSDDTSILHIADDAVHAEGLPRDPRLHRRSVEMLPDLAAGLDGERDRDDGRWDANDERFIRRERLPGLFVAPQPRPIHAFVSLERTDGALRVEPSDPYDGLRRLISDNLSFAAGQLHPLHGLKLDILTAALAQGRCWHVEGSGSPQAIAGAIREALERE